MPDDPDFGFYGKGFNGYVHYNRDFDENFPNRGGGGGGNSGGGGGSPTWLRVIVALAIVFFIFWLIDEIAK